MLYRVFAYFRSALAVILAVGLIASPALAQNRFGAIAISPSTLQTNASWNFNSQSAANRRAVTGCNALTNGANDCFATVAFHAHACGALAVDSVQRHWRGGLGNTIFEARNNALAALGSSNATIAQVQCNSNSSGSSNGNGNGSNSGFSNNKYGAIAVSPNTLATFGSWNYFSQNAANNRAISGCNGRSNGANDCIVPVVIHNQTCGALAEDTSQRTWKDGHANTRSQASSNALAALGSNNGTVVRSICNNNSTNTSTNTSSKNTNLVSGIIGLLAGAAAVAALTHHHANPTPAPTAVPAPVAVAPVAAAVAPVAAAVAATPPPVVSFGAAHFGAIAVNASGTYASVAQDRNTAADAMADAINACNAKSGGNSCTEHVQFTSVSYESCGAVAVRRASHEAIIGSATAGSQSDAQARALMKAGTGSTILAYGCNSH